MINRTAIQQWSEHAPWIQCFMIQNSMEIYRNSFFTSSNSAMVFPYVQIKGCF